MHTLKGKMHATTKLCFALFVTTAFQRLTSPRAHITIVWLDRERALQNAAVISQTRDKLAILNALPVQSLPGVPWLLDMREACALFDQAVGDIGMDGIFYAMRQSYGPDFPLEGALPNFKGMEQLVQFSYVVHSVGAWAMQIAISSRSDTVVDSTFALFSTRLAQSQFLSGAGPLHAAVWYMLTNTAMTTKGLQGPHGVWKQGLKLCSGVSNASATFYLQCIHGVGHGLLYVSLMGRYDFSEYAACTHVALPGTLTEGDLEKALLWCNAAPSAQYSFMAAGAVYDNYRFTILDYTKGQYADLEGGVPRFCATKGKAYYASCFHFLINMLPDVTLKSFPKICDISLEASRSLHFNRACTFAGGLMFAKSDVTLSTIITPPVLVWNASLNVLETPDLPTFCNSFKHSSNFINCVEGVAFWLYYVGAVEYGLGVVEIKAACSRILLGDPEAPQRIAAVQICMELATAALGPLPSLQDAINRIPWWLGSLK